MDFIMALRAGDSLSKLLTVIKPSGHYACIMNASTDQSSESSPHSLVLSVLRTL